MFEKPGDLVRWFGAVQGQDYLEALWGVGLRTKGAMQQDIERAIARREIVRTWPMRGTLHFVAPDDIKWMVTHLTPRVMTAAAARHRELELDAAVFTRAAKVCERVLQGGKHLTRPALYAALGAAGIRASESRGMHIMSYLAHRGPLCFGPRSGKQATFTLLEEWIPNATMLSRDEALAELALRYFQSHGPASLHDFAWWSGLPVADARRGIESVQPLLLSEAVEGRSYWFTEQAHNTKSTTTSTRAYLLPVFDEYVVAYRERSAVRDPALTKRVNAGGGIFKPIVVIDGRVVGTWKRDFQGSGVAIAASPFTRISAEHRRKIERAARRYGAFLQMPVTTAITR
ncbi:MAG: winged helix DNA-binding domain-containing protein [Gemmatimonadaceae bacterium]